jgi:hypothetical protein
MLINPVAVEKLRHQKSSKIKWRKEAPGSILSGHLDIFCLCIPGQFTKNRLFQQPLLFPSEIPSGSGVNSR